MNSFGKRLRLTIFGESHGPGVGVVLDGVPPGLAIDAPALQRDLDLRRPGKPLTSARRERDIPEILSGTFNGHTTGAPLCIFIRNEDADSRPYEATARMPRPGHADYTAHVAARGHNDPRGGGHTSGRLTAPLVAAGTIASQILAPHGIRCAAHLQQVHDLAGPAGTTNVTTMLKRVPRSTVMTAHTDLEDAFAARIREARKAGDSLGGAVEFAADDLPAGLGEPFFDSIESHLAHLLFAVPAVKGVEFGAGFAAAAMRGSEHNDPFLAVAGKVATATNHAGGILGGRSSGMPIWGRVAIKPTSTLPGRDQATVDLETMEGATLRATGRHDPCIAVRAVPVVQACLRIALAEFALGAEEAGLLPRRPQATSRPSR
ncbi:MAG: chorismate synthase [bacterium]